MVNVNLIDVVVKMESVEPLMSFVVLDVNLNLEDAINNKFNPIKYINYFILTISIYCTFKMMKTKPTAILLKAEDITEYEQIKEINKIKEQAELLKKKEKQKQMERKKLTVKERIGIQPN